MTALDATRAAFVAAIIAEPDEDVHRLVFADWLEEHGEEARADYIRNAIADGSPHQWPPGYAASIEVLLNPPIPDYAQGFLIAPGIDRVSYTVRRGFVHAVTLPAADWLAHADALTRAHPVREVRLTTWPCDRARVSIGSSLLGEFWRLDSGWELGKGAMEHLNHSREVLVRSVLFRRWPRLAFHLPP